MVYDNVLEAMGHTPLIRLRHIPDENCAQILVKFEALNVGGSIKTRTAYNMILQAERRGEIAPGKTTIIGADERQPGHRLGSRGRGARLRRAHHHARFGLGRASQDL